MAVQRVPTTIKKLLRLHMERNEHIGFGQAYDDVIAYLRRTQSPPAGPLLEPSPVSSIEGITPVHAANALAAATEMTQFTTSEISTITKRDYDTFRRWRY